MAELGTALAVVAFADQCLKYGDKFVKRCKHYMHAEEEAAELLISIESNWVKMETQIEIMKRIAGGLNKRLRDMQSQVLSQLEGKLKTASLIIEQLMNEKRADEIAKSYKWKHDNCDIATMVKGLEGMRVSKKARYVSKRSALYLIVDEIEKWQARYDPTWIWIMQMSIGGIDEELSKQEKKSKCDQIPIIIAAKGIRDAVRATQDVKIRDQGTIWIDADDLDLDPMYVANSSVQISTLEDKNEMVLIDTMICNPAANANSTVKEVRNLGRILAEVDPSTFGLLKCRGVIKVPKAPSSAPESLWDFKFIFDIPRQLSNPQSLRAVLLSGTSYPLEERLELAKKLTSSILFIHTVQFVHKNVRPETIVIFQNEHSKIGAPFLAGFEQFRLEIGNTILAGDDMWEHNLYRHPSRQGTHPETNYQMQHDIYSLGVVLLEIGLWTSFVIYDPEKESSSLVPNNILGPANLARSRQPLGGAFEIKQKLEALAESELPVRIGRRYTSIVLLCLRCLDPGSDRDRKGFGVGGADWTDEDGVVIGVRYIENVLEKIQEINI